MLCCGLMRCAVVDATNHTWCLGKMRRKRVYMCTWICVCYVKHAITLCILFNFDSTVIWWYIRSILRDQNVDFVSKIVRFCCHKTHCCHFGISPKWYFLFCFICYCCICCYWSFFLYWSWDLMGWIFLQLIVVENSVLFPIALIFYLLFFSHLLNLSLSK